MKLMIKHITEKKEQLKIHITDNYSSSLFPVHEEVLPTMDDE